MSSARILIAELIKSQDGYVPSRKIYRHLTSLGYKFNSVKTELSRMYTRGELVKTGITYGSEYQINPDYKPSARVLKAIACHSHLTLCNRDKPEERGARS